LGSSWKSSRRADLPPPPPAPHHRRRGGGTDCRRPGPRRPYPSPGRPPPPPPAAARTPNAPQSCWSGRNAGATRLAAEIGGYSADALVLAGGPHLARGAACLHRGGRPLRPGV